MLSTGNPETGRNENRIAYTKSHRNAGGFLNQDTCYLPLTKVPGQPPDASASWKGGVLIVCPLDDNKVPGYPADASASWKGGVLIVCPSDDNKVPGHPPDASASWKGGVLTVQ
jgi:hypothetical protein